MFQKFAQVPETGELDKATVKMMTQPRCGFKDILEEPFDPNKPFEFNAGKCDMYSIKSVTEIPKCFLHCTSLVDLD